MEVIMISVDVIAEPEKPVRSYFEAENFEALKESIKAVGVLQPISVKDEDKGFRIVFGHRRLLAAREAGLSEIPAVVVDISDEELLRCMVDENMVREDISPVDLATWLVLYKQSSGLTNEALGKQFGRGRGWVDMYVGLAHCDEDIQAAVGARHIDINSGRRLQSIEDPESRRMLLKHCVESGASQAVISSWVAREQVRTGQRPAAPPASGAIPESAPPNDLTFNCFWCGELIPMDKMITARFCGPCFTNLKAAVAAENKMNEEPEPERS